MKALIKQDIYDDKKMEAIYKNVAEAQHNGRVMDYEIRVDDFPAIRRSKDPERFNTFLDFVTPETRNIAVFIYYNNLPSASEKYFFALKPNAFAGLGTAEQSGTENKSEESQKEKIRMELHYEQLIEENAKLKKDIEGYEEALIRIEKEKQGIISNRQQGVQNIGDVLVNGLLNSQVAKSLLGDQGLSGTPNPQAQTTTQENTASFKRKEPEEVEHEEVEGVVVGEEDKQYIQLVKDIRSRVTEVDLQNVMHLLDLVTANPQSISFAMKQVNNFLRQNPRKA